MPDKASNSHIERTVYVSPNTRPGSSVRYGDWSDTEIGTWYDGPEHPNNPLGKYRARGIPLTLIEYTVSSDYSGSLVEISNARVLKERFPWLVEVYGGHGTAGLAYLGKRENQNDELIETIDALTDYPLADDSDHSDLECERESEAWSEAYGGAHDFRKALGEVLDDLDDEHEHDPDLIPDDVLYQLWRDGCEVFNVNGGSGYCNEQGDQIYFYIDEWIKALPRHADRVPYFNPDAQPPFRERVNALTISTRLPKEDSNVG